MLGFNIVIALYAIILFVLLIYSGKELDRLNEENQKELERKSKEKFLSKFVIVSDYRVRPEKKRL